MIKPEDFVRLLQKQKLFPFLMVPCSIFKSLNAWMMSHGVEVIVVPNEAHAMGMAVGTYSVTGRPTAIFLQNSGLNNIANAQTSLHALYKIPVLLVVSWRGEPGKKDAPEHLIMGRISQKYLKLLAIPFKVLGRNWEEDLEKMTKLAKKEKTPVAVIIREGIFEKENYSPPDLTDKYTLSRIEAIKIIKNNFAKKTVFISTNGFTSRDSFAAKPSADFYMMGSMGHAFSIGAGTAMALKGNQSKMRTVVLDGDGGCLMHLGSLALVGLPEIKKSNLFYILLDNEAHESTGSQSTLSPGIDFLKIADGLGFPQRFFAKTAEELKQTLTKIKPNSSAFIHLKINRQKIEETSRVSDKFTCKEIAENFRSNFH